MTDDAALAFDAAHGDADAFTELYERYIRRVYDFVYFKTHQRQTAEDITAQTFLQALENLKSFRPKRGNFSQWIHRIARNLVADHYRSLHPHSSIEDAWDISSPDDVERDADTAVKIAKIRSVLSTLTPAQREVVLLRLWHGYSFTEISVITGKSEAAAKMSYKRSIDAVSKDLLIAFLLLFFT